MTLSSARLLWLLAAGLAVLVAAEAMPFRQRATILPPPTPTNAPQAAASVPEPVAAWVATAVGRPLFAVDRRPPAVAAAASVAAGPQNLPRLAGIVVSPRGRSAIFAGAGDKSTVVAEGAAVGPWRVVAIHADAVDVAGPQGARTVKPAYSNQAAPAAAAQPIVPQSAALAGFLNSSAPNNPGNPILTPQQSLTLPPALRNRQ